MEKQILVSIIVPVYNVEKYILGCINSIAGQTYKNYEILIIDDGSTDRTCEICKNLQKENNKITLISKVNEGVSVARNIGVNMAKGEWIAFVDADDVLDPDYIYKLVSAADENINIVGCGFYSSWNKEDRSNVVCYDRRDWCVHDYLKLHNRNFAVWAYLFRKQIIVEHKIEFDKELVMSEDTLFFLQLLEVNSKLRTIDDVLYWHRINESSACGKPVSFVKVISFALAEKKIISRILKLDRIQINNICNSFERIIVLQGSKIKLAKNEKKQLFHILRDIQGMRLSYGKRSVILSMILMKIPLFFILPLIRMQTWLR